MQADFFNTLSLWGMVESLGFVLLIFRILNKLIFIKRMLNLWQNKYGKTNRYELSI
jgi:hypothetical protein